MHVLEHSVTHASNNSKLITTRHILEYSMTHNNQSIIHTTARIQNFPEYLWLVVYLRLIFQSHLGSDKITFHLVMLYMIYPSYKKNLAFSKRVFKKLIHI